ncbi:unnamed protein product [Miscanthus lutarioriparius]|uniref:Uncharacterized protein n=1 Tax=Miscanthus lutarioriparius TaxID=422564 RepID=A0A811NLX0_9POAL|nr:unnamed protein product [Miscanthus lutarioriparius]
MAALGQFVSLLITSTGFASSELARRGVNAPTSQSLLNYILLALVYGGTLLYKRQHMTIKWYYYLILGIVDVEANYIGMLQDETNIKPLWGTAQLFLHPRYMHGAATRKTKIAARHKHNS